MALEASKQEPTKSKLVEATIEGIVMPPPKPNLGEQKRTEKETAIKFPGGDMILELGNRRR